VSDDNRLLEEKKVELKEMLEEMSLPQLQEFLRTITAMQTQKQEAAQ
jgi:hypothetical protein